MLHKVLAISAITKNQIEDFAEKHKNVCCYAPSIMQMNWDEIFAVLTGAKKQTSKKEVVTEANPHTAGIETKTIIARSQIKDLIDELEKEVARSAFIRFFTDFNNTKIVKLAALENIYALTAEIKDFTTFSETVSSYVNQHPKKDQILFTTRPLTSRTATLINEITNNNGEAFLVNTVTLHI